MYVLYIYYIIYIYIHLMCSVKIQGFNVSPMLLWAQVNRAPQPDIVFSIKYIYIVLFL